MWFIALALVVEVAAQDSTNRCVGHQVSNLNKDTHPTPCQQAVGEAAMVHFGYDVVAKSINLCIVNTGNDNWVGLGASKLNAKAGEFGRSMEGSIVSIYEAEKSKSNEYTLGAGNVGAEITDKSGISGTTTKKTTGSRTLCFKLAEGNLKKADGQDSVKLEEASFIWAIGAGSTLAQHQTNRGFIRLNLEVSKIASGTPATAAPTTQAPTTTTTTATPTNAATSTTAITTPTATTTTSTATTTTTTATTTAATATTTTTTAITTAATATTTTSTATTTTTTATTTTTTATTTATTARTPTSAGIGAGVCKDNNPALQARWRHPRYKCSVYIAYCTAGHLPNQKIMQRHCPMSCGLCVVTTTAPPTMTTTTTTTSTTTPFQASADSILCAGKCTSEQACLKGKCVRLCKPGDNFAGCACQIVGSNMMMCANGYGCNKATHLCQKRCDWRIKTNCVCHDKECSLEEKCEAGATQWTCVGSRGTGRYRGVDQGPPGASESGSSPLGVIAVGSVVLVLMGMVFFVYQKKKSSSPSMNKSMRASVFSDIEDAHSTLDGTNQPSGDAAIQDNLIAGAEKRFKVDGAFARRIGEEKQDIRRDSPTKPPKRTRPLKHRARSDKNGEQQKDGEQATVTTHQASRLIPEHESGWNAKPYRRSAARPAEEP